MNSLSLWATLLGVAAPLVALAGSAVAFVIKFYQEASSRRRNHFFELMQFIDSDRPLATKMAAIYELRRFPEHKDFIVRFGEMLPQNVKGHAADVLINEMRQTKAFLETSRARQ